MRVLVVEDELKMASLLRRGLMEEGHAVDVARTGDDALWMARAVEYDAVVLDLMLPGIDGVEVCRRLRQDGVWTPVLMLTARDAVEDRVAGLDAGADDYLPKPFAFRELMARLRALTRRKVEAREGYRLEAHGIELDLLRRRASHGGRTIDLSPTEFALLEVLMRSQGRVLSRTEILDHVWGYESWPESNLVPVYVTYLRRKFKQLATPLQIKSVRGVGYVLGD